MNLLDTNLTMAVRCGNCGRIKFHRVSTFQLPQNSDSDFYCECGNRELIMCLKESKTIIIRIPCLACDISHTYRYSLKSIMKKRLTIICCNESGLEICFLGRDNDVKDIVSKYQEDLNLLLGELGLLQDPANDILSFKK